MDRTSERLPDAERARLRTWLPDIVEALLPGAQREDRGRDWRFTKSGGLCVCKSNGAWHQHSSNAGGYRATRLDLIS
jgi:hypothetical protein